MPDISQYDPIFKAAGAEWDVDPTLLKALAMHESGGRADVRGTSGEVGLAQLMPGTAAQLGVTNRADPEQAIYGMAKYMNQALTAEHENPTAALRYYNGGPGWRNARTDPKYPSYVAGQYQQFAKADTGTMTDATPALAQAADYNAPPAAPASVQANAAPASPPPPAVSTGAGNATSGADPFTAALGSGGGGTAKPAAGAAPGTSQPDPFTAALGTGGAGTGKSETKAAPAPVPPTSVGAVDEYGRPQTPVSQDALKQPLPTKQDVINWLSPAPGTTYGDVVPVARDDATGALRPALPNFLRSPLLGLAGEGPQLDAGGHLVVPGATLSTGGTLGVTPEAASVTQFAAAPLRFGGKLPISDVPMTLLEQRVAEVTTGRAPPPPEPTPIPPQAAANLIDPAAAERIAAQPPAGPVSETGVRPRPTPAPQTASAEAQPGGTQAAGAQVTSEPIPEPTPAQKATALQKMTNQSADDRLTPQGRDDNVYFPGVVRPEAMKDFSTAPEGQMSSALQHKTLYNTDSHYHDQFDAQVKANNAVMTDGTTLADGTRVEGLKDMFGDANARDDAMKDARALMPGSVDLFGGEKPTSIQPIADKINEILASGKGKIDAVANNLRPMLKKLYDAKGEPETLPSQIKGIYDDINNKLYDKSPTKEGNEARQAADQLKAVKAVVSDVIGKGLPGTKWTDYLTNLSGALGQVNKLDYMQQFLTGSKNLWGRDGMLQFGKVSKMLEDIQKHHADATGGARQMTMDEINKIEAVRNELAAKDLLDKRAGVRGSPTVQLGTGAGILGSGPLGTAVKTVAEGGAHLALFGATGGIGNVLMLGAKGYRAGREAAKATREANKLAATKSRLLDTNYLNEP